MELNKILNIRNIKVEDQIKKAIAQTKEELDGLDLERMCKIYSAYAVRNLLDRGVLSRFIDTKDLDSEYSHSFVIALDSNSNYLVDLTYSQFKDEEDVLFDLKENGYTQLNDEKWDHYLKVLPKENNFTIDEAINGKQKKSR